MLNSPFSSDSVYVCSSSDIWNEVESLSNGSFENISERRKRDNVVSKNGSSSIYDDNSMWQIKSDSIQYAILFFESKFKVWKIQLRLINWAMNFLNFITDGRF